MKEKIFDELLFSKIRNVKSPVRANPYDAGVDFFVPEDFEEKTLNPGEDVFIPSGIKVVTPENYAFIAFNKGGVALKKRLIVGAAVVDTGYENEMHLHLQNVGTEPTTISPGEKIVQFILVPVNCCVMKEIDNLEYDKAAADTRSSRGLGGFGSTGVK